MQHYYYYYYYYGFQNFKSQLLCFPSARFNGQGCNLEFKGFLLMVPQENVIWSSRVFCWKLFFMHHDVVASKAH